MKAGLEWSRKLLTDDKWTLREKSLKDMNPQKLIVRLAQPMLDLFNY